MPTADSFVGMPFMRPTLRMHCPSTLQRHTITGGQGVGEEDKGSGGGFSSCSAAPVQPANTHFCAHICIYMCVRQGACSSMYVSVYTSICVPGHRCAGIHRYLQPMGTCRHVYPAPLPASKWFPQELQAHGALALPRIRSCHIRALWLTTMGTVCSRGSTQCRARVR